MNNSSANNATLSQDALLHEKHPPLIGKPKAGVPVAPEFSDVVEGFQFKKDAKHVIEIPIHYLRELRQRLAMVRPSGNSFQQLEMRLCELRIFLDVLHSQLLEFSFCFPEQSSQLSILAGEVADISLVARDAFSEMQETAKFQYSLTEELGKAYKRFPELLAKNDQAAQYDGATHSNKDAFRDIAPVNTLQETHAVDSTTE